MPDYRHILDSSATRMLRVVVIDGTVHLQQFTATTYADIALSRAAAEDVLALAEEAEAAQAQERQAGDAYLAKLARRDEEMPLRDPYAQVWGISSVTQEGC